MRIFISYSSRNRQLVTALAADLERLGHDVWFDHELTGGHAWWNDILTNIRTCDLFVAALTPQLLDSYPCQLEGRYGAALNKRILPVLLANVETALIPASMSALQFVDYRQRNPDAVLALSRALGNLPSEHPMPSPLPKPPDVPLSPLANLRERIEAPGTLSPEEQSVLLGEIKELLAKRGSTAHARVLLQRLRARNDLLASVANDADALLQGGGRGRRTVMIALAVVIGVFILGYEGLSLLTLRRTGTPSGATTATVTTVLSMVTVTNTTQQVASILPPPTDTPTIPPTMPPTLQPTTAPAEPTNTLQLPNISGEARLTSEAYVSGAVRVDCEGFTPNTLKLQPVVASSDTPDVEKMVIRVHDGAGNLLYQEPISVGTTSQLPNTYRSYTGAAHYSPFIFTVSSGVEILGAESLYYLQSAACSNFPRFDLPPVNYPSVAPLTSDYIQIQYAQPPKQPIPQSGPLNIKVRYKVVTVPGDNIRSGEVHIALWAKRFADADCTVPIPVSNGLGIASSVVDRPIGLDSSEGEDYQVAYTALETPYIAVQGVLYVPNANDSKVLIGDYSTTAGCFKVETT